MTNASDLQSRPSEVDEWARLGTSLHAAQALRSLQAAERSMEDVVASHPTCATDIDRARHGLREAASVLRGVHRATHDAVPSAGSRLTSGG